MHHITLDPLSVTMEKTGHGRSTITARIKDGLFPPFIKTGKRSRRSASHETDAVIRALLSGKSDDEIRALVRELIAARTAK